MLEVVRDPKFGHVRLPTNAATNADFLNHIGQQTC